MPEKKGTIVGEGKSRRGRTATETCFLYAPAGSHMAGHLFHGLLGQMQAATTLLDSRSGHIPSPWSCDQTPRVLPVIPVVANVESPATEHHLLRNAHALPLLLPRVPRTASTSLEVTATATLKSPVIRLPTGTAHCPISLEAPISHTNLQPLSRG